MTLAPRAVVVHRRTELDELLDRYGTRGQAEFVLAARGRDLGGLQAAHDAVTSAVSRVVTDLPPGWRVAQVEREDLPRFLFAPEDVVLVVGQDGLVANIAKYLDGQPVLGVDPQPELHPGVLVTMGPRDVPGRLAALSRGDADVQCRSMVALRADDGQRLLALNEVYVGHEGHQSSRWTLRVDGREEPQSCSGLIAGTGTGASGWCASLWRDRRPGWTLPGPTEAALGWFVREAWPSPVTGTTLTGGVLAATQDLQVTVASDRLVAFGDGVEADRLTLTWGQRVRIGVADTVLRHVR
ncbi:MAG: hypothetical protein U0Q15_05465 [Kineosporiaceae bacterium]